VQLPRVLAEELISHAVADLPNECCGMIAGRDGLATSVHRATNTEASPFMYVMDPREQLELMDAIDEAGEDLLAIYHSHTRSAAYPSRTDVELAFFEQAIYVIVSLADPEAPEIRAFHLRRDQPAVSAVSEVTIEILEP
jgi:[CysO sulfur-carrier protein]-S-L-cysteine hydrolase